MIKNAWDSAEALAQARDRFGSGSNVAAHQFAVFLHENPSAKAEWVSIFEKERLNRELLKYNIPGFEERIQVVFTDLEILGQ